MWKLLITVSNDANCSACASMKNSYAKTAIVDDPECHNCFFYRLLILWIYKGFQVCKVPVKSFWTIWSGTSVKKFPNNFDHQCRCQNMAGCCFVRSVIVTPGILLWKDNHGRLFMFQNLDTSDLEPYMNTQVNFTTFKLVQETFSGGQIIPGDFSEYDYATTMDSLLTLYHGIHLHYLRRRNCHWSGKDNILDVLSTVGFS